MKERPTDPLSSIAQSLLLSAKKSFPTFEKFEAKKVYVQNQLNKYTLKIDVFLNFKGRSSLRYQHTYAFDPEEWDKMLYDEAGQTGLKTAIKLINTEIT